MGQTSSLSGSTVLVVEDDFYLAEDARDALQEAGARVLGPYATAAQAVAVLGDTVPDCAVIDLNLGGDLSFALARAIRARQVPVLFATGYDAAVIPADLADTPHLQKPFTPQKLVERVAALRRAAGTGS